jgi:hypothetical protein
MQGDWHLPHAKQFVERLGQALNVGSVSSQKLERRMYRSIMRTQLAVALGLLALTITDPAQAAWSCSANGLVSASYDGGGSAYVHLEGFSSGNTYPVTRKGKVATGTTKNGTKFTCREN